MSLKETVFAFEVDDGPDLRVTHFYGRESISDVFRFDIELVSPDTDIDFESVFNRPARLTIKDSDNERHFKGIVSVFEQTDGNSSVGRYRATLVPALWLLTLNQRSTIYQEQTIPDIVKAALKDNGLKSDDYEFRLSKNYVSREYVVQYQETDFNFISRWLEHEGIFYFFSEGKVVFVDNSARMEPIQGDSAVIYRPPAGLESAGTDSIRAVAIRQQMFPAEVILKDYNWRKPQLDLKAQTKAVQKGRGRMMEYGNHYKDNAEGSRLAQVRSEEIQCRQRLFEGQSDVWRLGAGLRFKIAEHTRKSLNREYLLVDVEHLGSQPGEVDSTGTDEPNSPGVQYSNRFTGIPANVSFRPLRKTPKPKMVGTMNAKVDGSGDGSYAEIDDHGRYKVTLPFDLSGKGGGKASRYIRMAQPYAGSDYGMHFPLHKGIEVIWTTIDGDPDRPIICGAVPNPDTGSPVTDKNHKKSVIRDYGGNEIVLDGVQDGQQMRLHAPKHKSTITLGNSITATTDSEICVTSVESEIQIKAQTKITIEVGASKLEMDSSGNITLTGTNINIIGSQLVNSESGGSGIQMTPEMITQVSGLIQLNP